MASYSTRWIDPDGNTHYFHGLAKTTYLSDGKDVEVALGEKANIVQTDDAAKVPAAPNRFIYEMTETADTLDPTAERLALERRTATLEGLVNGWKQYKDLAELGVTLGSEDIANIFSRMQDRSEITFGIATSTSNASQYPAGHNYGQVWMRKLRTASGTAVLSGFKSGVPFTFVCYYNTTANPVLTSWYQTAGDSNGTWTPQLIDTNGNEAAAYGYNNATWARNGKQIRIWINLSVTDLGNLSGRLLFPIPEELKVNSTGRYIGTLLTRNQNFPETFRSEFTVWYDASTLSGRFADGAGIQTNIATQHIKEGTQFAVNMSYVGV